MVPPKARKLAELLERDNHRFRSTPRQLHCIPVRLGRDGERGLLIRVHQQLAGGLGDSHAGKFTPLAPLSAREPGPHQFDDEVEANATPRQQGVGSAFFALGQQLKQAAVVRGSGSSRGSLLHG